VIGKELRDQGGMILKDLAAASERADRLIGEFPILHPELRSVSCVVRVTDDEGKEVYRTPLDAETPADTNRT
jgi:hypothetical protein